MDKKDSVAKKTNALKKMEGPASVKAESRANEEGWLSKYQESQRVLAQKNASGYSQVGTIADSLDSALNRIGEIPAAYEKNIQIAAGDGTKYDLSLVELLEGLKSKLSCALDDAAAKADFDAELLRYEAWSNKFEVKKRNRSIKAEVPGELYWGLQNLDSTPSIKPGEIVLIGARAGIGKTTFLANLALRAAQRSGRIVLFVSVKPDRDEIDTRVHDIADGLKKKNEPSSRDGAGRIIFIDGNKADLEKVGELARKSCSGALGLIVIDDADLMTHDDNDAPFVAGKKLGLFLSSLKSMAEELSIPVVISATCHEVTPTVNYTNPKLSEMKPRIREASDRIILLDRSMSALEADQDGRPDLCLTYVECAKDSMWRIGSSPYEGYGTWLALDHSGVLRDVAGYDCESDEYETSYVDQPENTPEISEENQNALLDEAYETLLSMRKEEKTPEVKEKASAPEPRSAAKGKAASNKRQCENLVNDLENEDPPAIAKETETLSSELHNTSMLQVCRTQGCITDFNLSSRKIEASDLANNSLFFRNHLRSVERSSRGVVYEDSKGLHPVHIQDPQAHIISEGMVLTGSRSKFSISWKASFESIGMTDPEKRLTTCGLSMNRSSHQQGVATVFRLLSCQAISIDELAAFSSGEQKALLKLCLERGVLLKGAEQVAEALAKGSKSQHGEERIRFILALCRKPSANAMRSFKSSLFFNETACLPSCYAKTLEEIAKQAEEVCKTSSKPVIAIKYADGAPIEEIAHALARALSSDGAYGLIDGGSVSSGLEFVGTSLNYYNARESRFTNMLAMTPSKTMVLTNIDRITEITKKDGDAVGFLLQAMGAGVSPSDPFLEAPINTADAAFILTQRIDSDVTDFDQASKIVVIPGLKREDKICAINELLKSEGIAGAEKGALEKLADEYAYDDGIKMARLSVATLAEHKDELGGRLGAEDITRYLPAPDETDERLWLARKRQSLEELGLSHIAAAEKLLADIKDKKNREGRREESLRKFRILVNSAPAFNERLPKATRDSLRESLLESHPNIAEITLERLCAAIISSTCNTEHARPLLLTGPAGVGKTTMVASIARALGDVEVVKRDMSSLSTTELFGSTLNASSFTEAAESQYGRPAIYLLDEVDKMDKALCSSSSLCSLLDQGIITDCYLNLPVDLSRNLFILTCNDIDKVSDYIINRVQVIEVEGYTPQDKVEIAKSVLIERKAKELQIDSPSYAPGVLEWLAELDDEAGIRSFENRLELLISASEGKQIDLARAKSIFPTLPAVSSDGIKVLMPRLGARGGAVCAAVLANRIREPKVEVVSGTEAFERSLSVARSAVSYCFGEHEYGMQVSQEKLNGDIDQSLCAYSQLGIAIAIECILKKTALHELSSTAFVGELSASGRVEPLPPEILLKGQFLIAEASKNGARTIICPENMAMDRQVSESAEKQDIALVGVATLTQATDFVHGKIAIENELKELMN